MVAVQSGKLRHFVRIYRQPVTRDSSGGIANPRLDDLGNPIGTAWAKISPISGSDSYQNDAYVGIATHKIVMRAPRSYRIAASMWVAWGGRRFDLLEVSDVDEAGVKLDITAKEIL